MGASTASMPMLESTSGNGKKSMSVSPAGNC